MNQNAPRGKKTIYAAFKDKESMFLGMVDYCFDKIKVQKNLVLEDEAFDLGILCFFPQIWASDDTDAVYRVNGMTGYSYGYPMSVIGAHVSACPNHQTLRTTPLETRFAVAAFGVLGYECNLCDMKREELEEIKAQIALYKEWREVLQSGTFYRGRNAKIHEWTCVSEDKRQAVGMIMQELVQPNHPTEQYFPEGLCASRMYFMRQI